MGTTRNRRAAVKKYTRLAHTSVLAISMGLSMGPVSMQAAGEADPQSVQPEVLPTAYSSPQVYQGDSISYFKNQFLGKSSFRALGSGEEAPIAINVGVSGFAQVGKVLTGTYTYSDIDGDNEDGSIFTWYRADDSSGTNISPIAGAFLETYTLTNDDLGKYITFQVKPQNLAVNGNEGLPVQSTPTAAIAAAAAAPTAINVAVSGFAQVGKELTGTYTYGDINGDEELGSRYKWYRSDDAAGLNKTAITGATGQKYVLTGDDLGKYIIFEVQPRNEFEDGIGELAASAPTAAIAAAAAAPTAANVAVSGNTVVGQTLTGTYTYSDVNGDTELGSVYQWYRSDDAAGSGKAEISGANGTTYVLTTGDAGKFISFAVTPKNESAPSTGSLSESGPTAVVASPIVEVTLPGSSVATATPALVSPAVQEEESLIEVVAVKKNDETINAAKLTLIKNTAGTERASFRFLTEEVIKAAQLASSKETMAVRVNSLKNAQTVYGEITGDAIQALIAKQQRLAVITGDVAIEFPSVSIPVQELAKQGGVSADQLKLEIRIEKQPESVKSAASQWAASQNASLIGEPYKFSVNVLSGTLSTPVIQYGDRYAYHTVPIPAGVSNLNSLGAVMLLDGKYVPVPVRIIDSGHAVIQTPTNATVMLVQRNQTFADLSGHWGINDLLFMADKDNVEGAANGSFNPGGSVSRSELASILVRSLGLGQRPVTAVSSGSFGDLPADPAAVRDIQLTIDAGLFQGYSDTVFAPDAEVTREQLIAVLMRFYQNFELELPALHQGKVADVYKDNSTISGWAEQYLNEAYNGGVVYGYENDTLGVKKAVTRDEAAAIIRRFLQRTNLTN